MVRIPHANHSRIVHFASLTWLVLLGVLLRAPGAAGADESPAALVHVSIPITSSADAVIRTLNRIAERGQDLQASDARLCLVLEFRQKNNAEGMASAFEPCLALARQLASPRMDGIKTVAYLPQSVIGHAVLPVLACEQIVMHPDAELGSAGPSEESASVGVRAHYREIADSRRTIPASIAVGMLDPSLGVFRLTTDKGARFVLEEELAPLREDPSVESIDTVMASGGSGRISGRDLRLKWSLISQLVEDPADLPEILGVRAAELEPDPSLAAGWKPVRLEIHGILNEKNIGRIVRTMEDYVRAGNNLIFLDIDSPGGSLPASAKVAGFLAGLDRSKVRTVAIVNQQARGDVALMALTCDQLVMRPDAILGGPGEYQPTPLELTDMQKVVEQWADEKGRHWSLLQAMIDPSLPIFRYQLDGTSVTEILSEEEWKQQNDPTRWVQGEPLSVPGEPARFDTNSAERLGIVTYRLDEEQSLWDIYGLEVPPDAAEPNWATELVHTLAAPQVAWALLFFAGFAMMSELSTPGLGAGAFSAAICLLIYFWSQFLNGTANWLEILLFLAGLSFVLLELLVLPGFGIFGFGGGVLIIASVVLASQTFVWPQNAYQYEQLPRSLLTVLAGGGGLIVGLFVLQRYLNKAPILKNVMLPPPDDLTYGELGQREAIANHEPLLGSFGTATTPLMPSGKARFGNELLDVLTDGEIINAGQRVEVVEVRGSRIVVRRG
jgi:membrane-bound serine protease (ClpP class)